MQQRKFAVKNVITTSLKSIAFFCSTMIYWNKLTICNDQAGAVGLRFACLKRIIHLNNDIVLNVIDIVLLLGHNVYVKLCVEVFLWLK